MKLTEHFSSEELTYSDTAKKLGIDNTVGADMNKLGQLAKMLEVIRAIFNLPLHINSAYRSPKLNAAVNGSKTSQHLVSEAADLRAPNGHTNKELFEGIKKLVETKKLNIGQLIWEYGTKDEPAWVHVSLPRTNGKPNNQILKLGIK